MSVSSLTLRTNVPSLRAQRHITSTEKSLSTSMGRLSSGLRINVAADDAAGLAISERLRAQVRSLGQAQRNANDGISMLQTAEGALNEIADMLIRMRELGIQAANGSLGTDERSSLNDEFGALKREIDRIADSTEFSGQRLLDGSLSSGVTFQVGIDNAATDQIAITLADSDSDQIGITSGASISTMTGARNVLSLVDTAITSVSSRRGDIGAVQNRLISTINNLSVARENLSAANSRIRDADVAAESAELARAQILMQAGVAVLAQANQLPGLALSLIG
jgi:flagellin